MNKLFTAIIMIFSMIFTSSCNTTEAQVQFEREETIEEEVSHDEAGIIANHNCINIDQIPKEWVDKAKRDLHIAYGHTSHGSQITSGLLGLTYFKGTPFVYKEELIEDSLDLRDNPFKGAKDLGSPDNKAWVDATRKYLDNNKNINVVMWSWCGQLSYANEEYVNTYLDLMQSLEEQYPDVIFVYMTGHLDGSGENGKLAQRNNQIREFCINNNKVLYDFADIESYNPDGIYFGDRYANDKCEYDSDGDKKPDKNWAQEWQSIHEKDVEWYNCYAAHSEPVNANMKANAAWWLFARLAGWGGFDQDFDLEDYAFYAEKLKTINVFKGTDNGFELDRVPTRLESATMVTRLLGGEEEAFDKLYDHPFTDTVRSWGNPYVGYLYHYNFTKGISDTKFGPDLQIQSFSYITFLLRILGYSDNAVNGDFVWDNALETVKNMAIISTDYYDIINRSSFNRGHMAKLTYLFLNQKLKDENMTLLEKLLINNVIDKEAAELLAPFF